MDLKISRNGSKLITESENKSIKLDRGFAKKIMKYSKEFNDVYQRIADDIDDGVPVDKGEMRELIYALRHTEGDHAKSAKSLGNKLYKMRMSDGQPEPASTPNVQTQFDTLTPQSATPPVQDNGGVPPTPPETPVAAVALEEDRLKEIYSTALNEFDPSGMFHDYTDKDPKLAQKIKARDTAAKSAKLRQKKKSKNDWKAGTELKGGLPGGQGGIDWGKFAEAMKMIREHETSTGKFLNEQEAESLFRGLFERFEKMGKVRRVKGKEEVDEGCGYKKEKMEEENPVDEAADTTRREKKIEKSGVPQRRTSDFNESKK